MVLGIRTREVPETVYTCEYAVKPEITIRGAIPSTKGHSGEADNSHHEE